MRQILDREMPVEQKRRPFPWFWLFGLLLGLGFTLGWFFWPGKSPAPVTRPAIPVADRVAPLNTPDKQTGTTSLPEPVSAPAAETTSGPVESKGYLSAEQRETISVATGIAGNSTVEPGAPKSIEHSKTANTSTPLTKAATAQTPEQAPAIFIKKTNNASVEPPTPSTAEIQPSLPTEPNPSDILPTLSTPIDPVAKGKSWAFGATAGVFSTLNPGYSGASIGFTTEWQPKAKWGLRSGLAYQYQKLRNNERSILSISTGSYVEATGDQKALTTNNTGSVNPDEYLAPVYIPVSRLHRLEAPLLGFWQPLKRWRLYGGFAVGTTVYAQSGSKSRKNNQVFEIQAGAPARSLNAEISSQVRNWDFRWSTGIGFKPNHRFSFDLMLHNPLHFSNKNKVDMDILVYPSAPGDVFSFNDPTNPPKAAGELSLLQLSATWFF